MKVLEHQLDELLESSTGQHGYWLVNHKEIIQEDLKSGIVTVGLRKMTEKLDDYKSDYVNGLYKKIEESR